MTPEQALTLVDTLLRGILDQQQRVIADAFDVEPEQAFDELRARIVALNEYEQAVDAAVTILGGDINQWGDMYGEELLELARLVQTYGFRVKPRPKGSGGRPKKLDDEAKAELLDRIKRGTATSIAADFSGVSVSTVKRVCREANLKIPRPS